MQMMALSVHQPYANQIAIGKKTVEYRSWGTNYRGDLLIVSTKQPVHQGLLCGYALAVTQLVNCHREVDGTWKWTLRETRIINPFPMRGQQGLYKVDLPDNFGGSLADARYRVYHLGYQNHKIEDLFNVASELNAVLCDIRYSPRSRQQCWNERNLRKMFGVSYEHIVELGNLNYKSSKEAKIVDMQVGLVNLLKILKFRPAILMCVCRDFSRCHRRLVAQELEKLSCQVEPLDWPKKNVQQQKRLNDQQSLF